jgi:hypothetical protein
MTTISSYLSVSTNIDKWRAIAAKKPDVQLETSYYKAHISKITSVDAFLKDRRLLIMPCKPLGWATRCRPSA